MCRTVIFIDGAIGVGKSTLIKFLFSNLKTVLEETYKDKRQSHGFRLDVLKEPMRNSEAEEILRDCDYTEVLRFILARKAAVISNWNKEIAADGLQELEKNILIVERSFEGDLSVRDRRDMEIPQCAFGYSRQIYLMLCDPVSNSEEQARVSREYTEMECSPKKDRTILRATRPADLHGYIAIVHRIAGMILK